MHWFLKVTFIIISIEIYSLTCRPIPNLPYLELRRPYNNLRHLNHNLRNKTSLQRSINVGVAVRFPTTKKYEDLEKLEQILYEAFGRIADERNNSSDCESCDEEEPNVPPKRRILKPAYECDDWDIKKRICILERNLGDTVTFYLSTGKDGVDHRLNVTWRKEFHRRTHKNKNPVEYIIDPDNPPENIIIGRKGFELRISPITETDIEYNIFSATLESHAESVMRKVSFMIRIVPIDLGFVYVGETIELNLRKFVSLPEQSMSFEWYMERDGELGTLPSNMKVSTSGSSIKIFELRQEQEGILACSVYTNLNILATKKRFLIKNLVKNKDVLQSSPNHTLIFKEALRHRRDRSRLITARKFSRHIRETDLAEDIEQALREPTTTEKEIPPYTTTEVITADNSDYNLEKDSQYDNLEQPQPYEEDENRYRENNSNLGADLEVPQFQRVDVPNEQKPIEEFLGSSEEPRAQFEEAVERPLVPYNHVPLNQEIPFQTAASDRDVNIPLTSNQEYMNSQPYEYQANKIHKEYIPKSPVPHISKGMQTNNPLLFNKNHHRQKEQHKLKKKPQQDYVELDIQEKKKFPIQKNGYSDTIFNIDRIAGFRQVIAEEKISELISHCFSDFDCSVSATCARNSLKTPGFCKCLPGYNGIGIFCREAVWLSNKNLDMRERNTDDREYSGNRQ